MLGWIIPKRKISLFAIVLIFGFVNFDSLAVAATPKTVSTLIETDFNMASKQLSSSRTEFWDLQIRVLESPESKAVEEKYRLIGDYQISESQFLVEKALINYREEVNNFQQMKTFFPDVHQKLVEVIDIWIEKRGARRPFTSEDLLPGELRNNYPKLVDAALNLDSIKSKLILIQTSKALNTEKTFQISKFDIFYRFFYNTFEIERIIRAPANTPREQEKSRSALLDAKKVNSLSKNLKLAIAKDFNSKMGNKYIKPNNLYSNLYNQSLNIYKFYLKK